MYVLFWKDLCEKYIFKDRYRLRVVKISNKYVASIAICVRLYNKQNILLDKVYYSIHDLSVHVFDKNFM
jgi:hypothetical protein